MKTQGMGYTIIFTFIIAFIFVLLLSLANVLTKERTELNAKISLQKGVLAAAGIDFADNQDANEKYEKLVTIKEVGGQELYVINADPTVYGKIFSGNGLWGNITGIIVVDEPVQRIKGVGILSHNETPGLGGKIDEPYYKAQFTNEKISAAGTINIGSPGKGDTDSENSEIDGISGASQTSQLYEIIINNSLKEIKTLIGGLK